MGGGGGERASRPISGSLSGQATFLLYKALHSTSVLGTRPIRPTMRPHVGGMNA